MHKIYTIVSPVREYRMRTLQKQLSNLTDPDANAAEQTRDTLLSELSIPADWTVIETDVEMAQDETQDWFLAGFQHKSNPDKRASLFLLEGSHSLQLYIESPENDDWSEPTRDSAEITTVLSDHS